MQTVIKLIRVIKQVIFKGPLESSNVPDCPKITWDVIPKLRPTLGERSVTKIVTDTGFVEYHIVAL